MKTYFFLCFFFLTSAQEKINQFTIDGETYVVAEEKEIKLVKDKHDSWNLMTTVVMDDKVTSTLVFRTPEQKMPSGTYGLEQNDKRISAGKIAFSVNILDPKKGGLAILSMKQFTSTGGGQAIVKNENGIYSITLVNAEGINLKRKTAILNANLILDPNDSKSRKELTADNKTLNMSKAFIKEATYLVKQSKKFDLTVQRFKNDNTSENRDKIEEKLDLMLDSNDELLSILNRPQDTSIPTKEKQTYIEQFTKSRDQLKNLKKEIKSKKFSEIADAFIAGLAKGY